MSNGKKSARLGGKATAAIIAVAFVACTALLLKSGSGQPANSNPPPVQSSNSTSSTTGEQTVDLTPSQLSAIKIEAVGTYAFSVEKSAVGSIDYDEDLSVQVFSSYPGKIIDAFAVLGDEVKKGEPLYTIESQDLIQAESTLIGAVANFNLTSNALARAKTLGNTNGISAREMEQTASAEETAEGALKAARDAVHVFGKSEAQIDQIVATRKIEAALVVASPVTGRVTARNAQPGMLVQPSMTTAPYSVADLTTKWMVANVIESDSPMFHAGQSSQATLLAYPGRIFAGRISKMGASIDPVTHRVMVRCEIADPKDELRPGMLASFVIRVGDPVESVSIPVNGAVRNGDGTMAAWVTTDRRRFTQRIVRIGLRQDGQCQVLEGLQRGELAVSDGAVFISNILYAPPAD
jgi:cobalt-zinc-cadmium efflux system membrane fusion protein